MIVGSKTARMNLILVSRKKVPSWFIIIIIMIMTMVMMMTAKPSKYLNKLLVNVTLDFQTNVCRSSKHITDYIKDPTTYPMQLQETATGMFPLQDGKWGYGG